MLYNGGMKKTFYPPKSLYEKQIEAAIKEGVFDNLEGKGQPLPETKTMNLPEEYRLAMSVPQQGDFIPPEVEKMKRAAAVRALLKAEDIDSEKQSQFKKELGQLDCEINLLLDKYRK